MGQSRPGLSRRDFIKMTAATAAATSLVGLPGCGPARRESKLGRHRVLVLGIDGLSPILLRQYVNEGRMPHFARLMQTGDFKSLGSSMPPQSPVAWSNFITGMNPGKHGIYDFIHRDPRTLTPYLSTSRTSPASAVLPFAGWRFPLWGGGVENLRQGPAFWKILADQGVPCTLFRLPANFPPVECDARTLSGLGTPDLLGAYGVSSYITDVEPPNRDQLTDTHVSVVDLSKHKCEAFLVGPENTFRKHPVPTQVKLVIERDPVNPVARITIQGREILLKQGEWSDWIPVRFEMLAYLADVGGICRFFLKEVRPHLKLYVSPINLDPSDPALPISTPSDFSEELARKLGRFYTQGLAEDTRSLSSGLLSDRDYLEQAMMVHQERMSAYDYLLSRFDRGLLFFYVSTIDLNSHMFWRTMDPRHPLYTPELGRQFGKTLEDLYVKMDGVLAKAFEHLDDDTTLIVLSDHGFQPFYRTFSPNSWLLENGYAKLRDPARRGTDKLYANTNWDKTYAYGLGINGIYLNRRGRELHGSVSRGRQANLLREELVKKLAEAKDPETGRHILARVYKKEELYSGPHLDAAPDIILGFDRGYCASWKTRLGGYEKDVVADNTDKWSGDHCMDLNGLRGVLLSNKKITADDPALVDLAPTILAEYGIAPPPGTDGKAVLG